ncbi:hypothetical protein M422DRAFT_255093 [Sphaerobolus stellatus SS14]|uniref:Uncharacterized protein n=1 Tax=Sphaerobolus stellatus (strain SS14) TaxID=990650 RepID=A0A0C9VTB8_SPHS4|nr:hypothetical protein M422DRAFT_255093 [Sphaerobolus stellatus SS14]
MSHNPTPSQSQVDLNIMRNQTEQATSFIPMATGTTFTQPLGGTTSTIQSVMPNPAASDINPLKGPEAAGNASTSAPGIPLSSSSLEELSKVLSQHIIELTLPHFKRSKSEHMHKLDADIRENTNMLLKWNHAEHPFAAPPLPPSDDDLESFAKRLGIGPTVENFTLDLRKSEKMSEDKVSKQCHWNTWASVVFARDFMKRWEGKEWPYLPHAKVDSFIAQRFREKLGHLKDVYMLQLELNQATPQEQVIIMAQIRLDQKPEHHRAHREESLELRKKIVIFHNFPPGYLRMLETLGPDGMSSDETDEGHVNKLNFVIDKVYDKPNRLGAYLPRQGNTRRIRLGTHPSLFHMGRIPEYPKELYNIHYLQKKFPGALQVLQQSPAWQVPHPLPERWLDGWSELADQFTDHIWAGYEADAES